MSIVHVSRKATANRDISLNGWDEHVHVIHANALKLPDNGSSAKNCTKAIITHVELVRICLFMQECCYDEN